MSSLAAARADNFYYGPAYNPRKHGSLNKFRGSHPLGERAKRINEGILVIRFEMPYKVFCDKCEGVIAKGVRFNAEKRVVGHYFSTPILEFSMKCCFCDNILKITTDPKNSQYLTTGGLRKKNESFKGEDIGTAGTFLSIEERAAMEKDPMLSLEKTSVDLAAAKAQHGELEELIEWQRDRNGSEAQYSLNAKARQKHREAQDSDEEKEGEKVGRSGDEPNPSIPSDLKFRSQSTRAQRRLHEMGRLSERIFAEREPKEKKKKRKGHDAEEVLLSDPECSAISFVVTKKTKRESDLEERESQSHRKKRLCAELNRLRMIKASSC